MKPANQMGWPHGFVVYDETDLAARDLVVGIFTHNLKKVLSSVNRAIRFVRIETPMLTHKSALSGHEATGFELVKASFAKHGSDEMYLRPETTFGTYAAFKAMWPMEPERRKQMPICLWQYGKSFRDEQSRPMAELRFMEFYQLEYQLFFSADTKADYFLACLEASTQAVESIRATHPANGLVTENVTGKDLAHYSLRTTDIHVYDNSENKKIEVAAISERKDFDGAKVVEVSVGLDRLTYLQKVFQSNQE